jgi:uncharacterized protein YjbI with pentapeptide repeats
MADPEHLALIQQGVGVWNAWRAENPSIRPALNGANLKFRDLSGANLSGANLSGANLHTAVLSAADLSGAHVRGAVLRGADLRKADLSWANLREADLNGANLSGANLSEAALFGANFRGANLSGAILSGADLREADLSRANLSEANFHGADLSEADLSWAVLSAATLHKADLRKADLRKTDLSGANLREADLSGANLRDAILNGADLSGANLREAQLVETNLVDATLTDCRIYGISAWNVKVSKTTKQHDLVITAPDEPQVTVDNIEVAQFVYLLLHNEKIRDVIDTVGKKGVLLLGRFTEGRIVVLDRLRDELRKRGYLPIIFNFDKPETKDFTQTVRLLAGLSKFVIADITNPKSAPLELQATVPEIMVPFQPIIEQGEEPFAMLEDLQRKHDWVFKTLRYSSLDRLIETMEDEIIKPAEAKFKQLLARLAEPIEDREV